MEVNVTLNREYTAVTSEVRVAATHRSSSSRHSAAYKVHCVISVR